MKNKCPYNSSSRNARYKIQPYGDESREIVEQYIVRIDCQIALQCNKRISDPRSSFPRLIVSKEVELQPLCYSLQAFNKCRSEITFQVLISFIARQVMKHIRTVFWDASLLCLSFLICPCMLWPVWHRKVRSNPSVVLSLFRMAKDISQIC